MRARVTTVAVAVFCGALALAPEALAKQASDNGDGFAGELTDKYVTFFSLGVLLFFLFVICLFSTIQYLLDRRKKQKQAIELHTPAGW